MRETRFSDAFFISSVYVRETLNFVRWTCSYCNVVLFIFSSTYYRTDYMHERGKWESEHTTKIEEKLELFKSCVQCMNVQEQNNAKKALGFNFTTEWKLFLATVSQYNSVQSPSSIVNCKEEGEKKCQKTILPIRWTKHSIFSIEISHIDTNCSLQRRKKRYFTRFLLLCLVFLIKSQQILKKSVSLWIYSPLVIPDQITHLRDRMAESRNWLKLWKKKRNVNRVTGWKVKIHSKKSDVWFEYSLAYDWTCRKWNQRRKISTADPNNRRIHCIRLKIHF